MVTRGVSSSAGTTSPEVHARGTETDSRRWERFRIHLEILRILRLKERAQASLIAAGYGQDVAESARGTTLQLDLGDIDTALARIDAGSYGTCTRCGSPIPPERLASLPAARDCVACGDLAESTRFILAGGEQPPREETTVTTDVITPAGPVLDETGRRTTKQHRSDPAPLTAAQVMSRQPAVVDAHTSLFSAWGQLHGQHDRYLVVIDEDARPIGVLNEGDIALEWPPGPLGAHHVPVYELLRFRARPRVRGDDDMVQVARTMLGSRADALPVVDDDGRLRGLITVWHCVELITRSGGRDQGSRQEPTPVERLEPA